MLSSWGSSPIRRNRSSESLGRKFPGWRWPGLKGNIAVKCCPISVWGAEAGARNEFGSHLVHPHGFRIGWKSPFVFRAEFARFAREQVVLAEYYVTLVSENITWNQLYKNLCQICRGTKYVCYPYLFCTTYFFRFRPRKQTEFRNFPLENDIPARKLVVFFLWLPRSRTSRSSHLH